MKTVFTNVFIKNLKQSGRYTDAATVGLNFNVKSNGGGYWVFRYLFAGKRLDMSLGAYPIISLKEARKRAIANALRNSKAKGREAPARPLLFCDPFQHLPIFFGLSLDERAELFRRVLLDLGLFAHHTGLHIGPKIDLVDLATQ